MVIYFGPAGLGPVKTATERLEEYHKLGLKACEIAFTYGVYIHNEKDAEEIGKTAKKLDINLSIHAPYWINLNSEEKKKVEESKKRILDCCKIGEVLQADVVVFHPGYYGKMKEEETYENIKNAILEIQKEIKKHNWKIKIAPETMGKVNVFGSIEQIAKLVEETNCSFCIDFAHVLAREKKVDYEKIRSLFKPEKWHCHFSGIVYSEKGERHHIKTPKEKWKELLDNLPKNKDIIIINESPDMINDSVDGLKMWKG
ncbi:MAG: TIM barrel protein [Candidatus Nanoarchaeia archaeon]|nr:TIM barrel protein [Candidatus Nanoarchaeia archaeon]